MTEEELIKKMDMLGQCLYDLEQKQIKFDEANRELVTQIAELKDQLKPVFVQRKTGMVSEKLKVVYRKGAIRWDSKSLNALMDDYPWLANCRKESEPTIAFEVREEHDDDGR